MSTRPVTSDPVVRLYSVQSGRNYCFLLFLSFYQQWHSLTAKIHLTIFEIFHTSFTAFQKSKLTGGKQGKIILLYSGVNVVNSAFTETPSGVTCRFGAMASRF